MDRETLLDAIKEGSVRIHMNDGRNFDIPSAEFALVDSTAAHVLIKNSHGRFRARILSLVCMTQIEKN